MTPDERDDLAWSLIHELDDLSIHDRSIALRQMREGTHEQQDSEVCKEVVAILGSDEPQRRWEGCQLDGKYNIKEFINFGAVGWLYRATQQQQTTTRSVAIKLFPPRDDDSGAKSDLAVPEKIIDELTGTLGMPRYIETGVFESEQEYRAYLVMEWIPGAKPLTDYARNGSLTLNEKLDLFRRLGEAVDAWHRKGWIHRDLKPDNILVSGDGDLFLLDLGLARRIQRPTTAADRGVGTRDYMAPEQEEGSTDKQDRYTDVYALGVILHELITGSLPGETISLDSVSTASRSILAKCVMDATAHATNDRSQNVGQLLQRLAEVDSPVTVSDGVPTTSHRFVMSATHEIRSKSDVTLTLGHLSSCVAMSSDGERVAFVGIDSNGQTRIYLREMNRVGIEEVPGTDGAICPFFHDEEPVLGFFRRNHLCCVRLGSPTAAAQRICPANDIRGANWQGSRIVFCDHWGRTPRVVAANPRDSAGLTDSEDIDAEEGLRYHWPQWIPGTDLVLVTVGTASSESAEVRVAVLDARNGALTTLHPHAYGARLYGQGHYLFVPSDGDHVHRQRFELIQGDDGPARNVGSPELLDEEVACNRWWMLIHADASHDGDLVYMPSMSPPNRRHVVSVPADNAGLPARVDGPTGNFAGGLSLSPDATRLAVLERGAVQSLCLYEFDATTNEATRLIHQTDVSHGYFYAPVWSPDGRSLIVTRILNPAGSSYRIELCRIGLDDLDPRCIHVEKGTWIYASDWSAERDELLVVRFDQASRTSVWSLPGADPERMEELDGFADAIDVGLPSLSPNGRLLAASVKTSGNEWRIFVHVRDAMQQREVVQYGRKPRWAPDGNDLFWITGRTMHHAPFDTDNGSTPGPSASPLEFRRDIPWLWEYVEMPSYAILPISKSAGRRILMVQPSLGEFENTFAVARIDSRTRTESNGGET